MTISVQTVATGLMIFVALGIIFIGIRECFQPSVVARQFGVPLATPANRDFLTIKASRDIAPGVAGPGLACHWRSQSGCVCHVSAEADPDPRWRSRTQARGLDFQAGHSDSLGNGRRHVDDRCAVPRCNVASRKLATSGQVTR
jgi:hypothetical protein